MNPQARKRLQLGLIAVLFLLPFIVAVVLRFGGWQPPQTRNHGELLEPPLPMTDVRAWFVNHGEWHFENLDREWSLLIRLPSECDLPCRERLELLTRVREAQGRHAGKLHLFVIGSAGQPLPESIRSLRLAGPLPDPMRSVPTGELPVLWLVDPHGFLVMHYPSDFDPTGLRRDLSRLVR